MYRVRDFIETPGGLVFAVISNLHPSAGVMSNLRFLRTPNGMVKVESSQEAEQRLSRLRPRYLRFLEEFDRELTLVPEAEIIVHHRPQHRLKTIVEGGEDTGIVRVVNAILSHSELKLCEMGITGSHLIGAQKPTSDIDLVVYGMDNYRPATNALRACAEDGVFSLPREADWRAIYRKRRLRATDYTLKEFVWHESRKYNRAVFHNRRIDILSARKCQEIEGSFAESRYARIGEVTATGRAVDCNLGWDYPARYAVIDCRAGEHEVKEVVSFTHTYVDQIREGERGLFRGMLEKVEGRERYNRILVGTSREAPGECIKVLGP